MAARRRTSRPSCGWAWATPGCRRGVLPHRAGRTQALVEVAGDGDVVAVMCHAEREEIVAWLRGRGGVADDPDGIRRKVVRARGEHEAEDEIAALWDVADAGERVERAAALRAAHPGDARITYELAGAHDSAGRGGGGGPALRGGAGPRPARAAPPPGAGAARVEPAQPRAAGRGGRRSSTRPLRGTRTASVWRRSGPSCTTTPPDRPPPCRDLLATLAATSTDPDVVRYRRALAAYAAELEP